MWFWDKDEFEIRPAREGEKGAGLPTVKRWAIADLAERLRALTRRLDDVNDATEADLKKTWEIL